MTVLLLSVVLLPALLLPGALLSVVLLPSLSASLLAGAAVGCAGWFTRPNIARRRTAQNLGRAPTGPVLAGRALSGNHLPGKATYQLAVDLGSIIDIVMVGVSSGLSALAALQLAARSGPPRLGQHLGALLERDELPLADALNEFGRYCGPSARPFIEVLASSIRYGIELVPALERIQHDLREETRRRIDKRVRRLPVLMLFPLVFFVLPALGLVGVVPVLVAAFQL